jgi:galactokinase
VTEASLETQVGRAIAAFRERTGRDPEGAWAAPGRVNLIGEHTDYQDGFVLPIAIDRHAVAAAAKRTDRRLRLWSLQEAHVAELDLDDLGPGAVAGWAAYASGVAWSLRREGVDMAGFDLVLDGAVPSGSGLSSSASVECSVALALADLHDARLERPALALAAQRAEVDVVGVPCGVMDQMASLCCREGHALFLDTRTLDVDHVSFDLARAGPDVLLVDTRIPRRLTDGRYAERRAESSAAAAALGVGTLRDATASDLETAQLGRALLRRARHVVTENARVLEFVRLLRAGRLSEVGPLLTESHRSLREDYEVTGPALDLAVRAALEAGALGARMTGGGFGGCALALVPERRASEVEAAVRRAFSSNGLSEPHVFPVRPVGGARRLR